MRRIADLYPGEAKTDARDVFIIADAACTMPRTLRDPEPDDETIAALHMLLGFDDDLAAEATRTSNRMRGLLTAIHPHLERVIGPRIRHPAVLDLLERYGSPGAIQSAGLEEITEVLRPGAPRMAGRLAADIVAALQEQTVTVPGANSAAIILPSLAASLRTVLCSNAPSSSPPSPLWPTRHPAPTAMELSALVGYLRAYGRRFSRATHCYASAARAQPTRATALVPRVHRREP